MGIDHLIGVDARQLGAWGQNDIGCKNSGIAPNTDLSFVVLHDITIRGFVRRLVGVVNEAALNHIEFRCINNPVISKKRRIALLTVETPRYCGKILDSGSDYSSPLDWMKIGARRVGRNSDIGHVSEARIVSIYSVILDFVIHVHGRLSAGIGEIYDKMDAAIGFQPYNQLGAYSTNPSSLSGLEGALRFDDAPNAYENQEDSSYGDAEMSVGGIFLKLAHGALTCLLFVLGLFFDVLTLICLAPIAARIAPNIAIRWLASLSCLALSVVFLGTAFSRGF
jgi:hypothetical protein